MRSGIPVFGAIERAIQTAMSTQFWRYRGIPIRACSEYSSGKIMDYQAGYEKALQLLLTELSGCNLLVFSGGVYGEKTYHPVMSVMDDDVAGMVGRVIQGVEVTDDSLAVDVIEEVRPVPGHFLNREHTRRWWKKDYFLTKVADRLPYQEWIKEGKKDILSNASERVQEILTQYCPLPLPKEEDREIESILKAAKKYYEVRN